YLLAAYGLAQFPPGLALLSQLPRFMAVLRDYLSAHAKMAAAVRQSDTTDADGDGVAASVGLSLAVVDWVPAHDNRPSSDPADAAARDRVAYVFHQLVVRSLLDGTFDADLDG